MKRAVVALSLVLVAASASAQVVSLPAGPVSRVYQAVDLPAEQPWSGGRPEPVRFADPWVYFAGWSLNCNGTTPVVRLLVWSTSEDRYAEWPSHVVQGIYRPDVGAYARWIPGCVATDYAGWHLYPGAPLPVGAQAVVIEGGADAGRSSAGGKPIRATDRTYLYVVVR